MPLGTNFAYRNTESHMPTMLYLLFAAMAGQGILQGQARTAETPPARYYFHAQPEKALSLYLKRAASGDAAAALEAALILQELGRNPEALALLEKARLSDPDLLEDSRLNLALAWAHLYSGDAVKAEELFSRFSGKDEPRARLGLALARLKAENYDAAAGDFEKLSANRGLSALAYFSLAAIAEEKGDAAKAARLYERALKEDSHFVEGRPRIARIFEDQKRFDEAWKHYSKTAMMDPSQKLAAEKSKSLQALLTKKPEEILEVKKIREFSAVRPIPDRTASPEIRIGIGTTAGGAPLYKERIVFRVSGAFQLLDAKTGRELASGKGSEAWSLKICGGTGNPCPNNPNPGKGEAGSAPDLKRAARALTGAALTAPDGASVFLPAGKVLLRAKERGAATLILEAVPYAPGMAWSGVSDKELRGDLEVAIDPARGLFAVNRLPLEEYLYGVIAAEMPVHWPAEALKAQAVIARTYALYLKKHLHPHSSRGYDLCDDQHCQVYSGVAVESSKTRAAADQTRGKVLSCAGKAIHAVFSSNCGGHTQSGAGAGWANLPYWGMVHDGEKNAAPESPSELHSLLRASPEVYCRASKYTWAPESRWTRLISAEDLSGRLDRRQKIGKLKRMIVSRSESGRVASLRFVGTGGDIELTKEHEIRRLLGIAPLRSTFFGADVFYEQDFIKGLLIYGAGWGHGVGLCQSGAAGRAEAGQAYDKILPAYYPGARVGEVKDLK